MKQILLMIAVVALVGCGNSLTEEELVGTYEIKGMRVGLLANGECFYFETKNGEMVVVDGKIKGSKFTWKIVGKEVHADTLIFRIEKNGDLTSVAQIVRGKRKAYPIEEQFTFKKSNEGVEPFRLTAVLPAAERGDVVAQNNLGLMYLRGDGVPKDLKEAVKWYQKAADQGDARAQFNLGAMYCNGQGVEQNYVTGYALWNIAATNGNQDAKYNKSIVAKKMTPAEIVEAEELVKEMVKKNPKLLK